MLVRLLHNPLDTFFHLRMKKLLTKHTGHNKKMTANCYIPSCSKLLICQSSRCFSKQ